MVDLYDEDESGRPGYIAVGGIPGNLSKRVRVDMMGPEVRGRYDEKASRWFVEKSRYRALWRFFQRHYPNARVTGPGGTFEVDPTPGVVSSMGLSKGKPAWMNRA